MVCRRVYISLALVILLPYIVMYDRSSTLMAKGYYYEALVGEYAIGRLVNFLGIIILAFTDRMSLGWLLVCYLSGYLAILVYYSVMRACRHPKEEKTEGIAVSPKKVVRFQVSDMASGVVNQAPVILQYAFNSSYTAGFVAIVVLVKRLVNFVSGPTGKVFMPEFARLYRTDNWGKIRSLYALVMRIQMMFISCLCIPMLLFPKTLLGIFDASLLQYETIFRLVSLVFLIMTTLGPSTSLMQMTGQEKWDNAIRWISIVVMALTWIVLRSNPLFTLYGLCAQLLVEGLAKFVIVCKFFRNLPQPIHKYILMWVPVIIIWLGLWLLHIPDSFWMMALAEAVMLVLTVGTFFIEKDTRTAILTKLFHKKTKSDTQLPEPGDGTHKEN